VHCFYLVVPVNILENGKLNLIVKINIYLALAPTDPLCLDSGCIVATLDTA
jgi:hypothetical protein